MSEYCCAATSVSPISELSIDEEEGVEERQVPDRVEDEMVNKAIDEAESEEQSKGEKGIDDDLACGPCGGEDAQTPKAMKEPQTPSADEIAQHYLTHMPYRSWCPHCVSCRRGNSPHLTRPDVPRKIPLLWRIIAISATQ